MGSTPDTRLDATFAAPFGLELLGVPLIPTLVAQLDPLPPELADLPLPPALAASLIHAALVLADAVAVRTLLVHGVRLRSMRCGESAGQETKLASAALLRPKAFHDRRRLHNRLRSALKCEI